MYTCGPTVYNFAHIGNFRTYVFEDLLRRTLKFFGYKVTQVMNITDIDDKTIRGALAEKVSLKTFTDKYTKAFFEDLQTLKIEKVEFYPHATDFVPQMIEIVQGLLDQGIAYKGTDGSIYFAIEKFPSYGRLSHLHLDELKAGASHRVATDEYDKEHIADFALWKAYDPERDGQIFWDSPFGKGRPGWHIECSAMAMDILGKTIDIMSAASIICSRTMKTRLPNRKPFLINALSGTGSTPNICSSTTKRCPKVSVISSPFAISSQKDIPVCKSAIFSSKPTTARS
jgi:cysteinyl-tRNA synthetase